MGKNLKQDILDIFPIDTKKQATPNTNTMDEQIKSPAIDEKQFRPEFYNYTTNDVKNYIDRTHKLFHSYYNLEDFDRISFSDMEELIYYSERTALILRAQLEEKERSTGVFFDKDIELGYQKDFPITIYFDGKALIAKGPLTIKSLSHNTYHGKVLSTQYEKLVYTAGRIKNKQDPGFQLKMSEFFRNKKLVAIVKRKILTTDRKKYCDNDNIENGKLLNALCQEIITGDGPEFMDLCSVLRRVERIEDVGTELIITERCNLQEYY